MTCVRVLACLVTYLLAYLLIYWYSLTRLWVILLTDRQTDRTNDRQPATITSHNSALIITSARKTIWWYALSPAMLWYRLARISCRGCCCHGDGLTAVCRLRSTSRHCRRPRCRRRRTVSRGTERALFHVNAGTSFRLSLYHSRASTANCVVRFPAQW